MTEIDNSTTAEIIDRLRDELDPTAYESLDDSIGWRCRLCGGRFALSEDRPLTLDRLERAVSSLLEAAAYHQRADHSGALRS